MNTNSPGFRSFNDGVACSLGAQQARDQGNPALAESLERQALSHFEEAILLDPQHAGALSGKGMTLAQLGDPARAAEAFLEAIKGDPTFPENYRQLGLCHIELGNIQAARQFTLKAVELVNDPEYSRNASIEVYNFGGYVMTAAARHREAGRRQEEQSCYRFAIAVFQLALLLDPRNEHARQGESIAHNCVQGITG